MGWNIGDKIILVQTLLSLSSPPPLIKWHFTGIQFPEHKTPPCSAHSSVVFRVCTELYNQHHCLTSEHCYYSQSNPYPLTLAATGPCTSSMDLPILDISPKWNLKICDLCDCLLSLSKLFSRFTHVVVVSGPGNAGTRLTNMWELLLLSERPQDSLPFRLAAVKCGCQSTEGSHLEKAACQKEHPTFLGSVTMDLWSWWCCGVFSVTAGDTKPVTGSGFRGLRSLKCPDLIHSTGPISP